LPAFILFFDFHFEKKIDFWGITQNWVMTLFIYKQVYDVDFNGFQIRDDRKNKIVDDASTLQILSMDEQERKEDIHINIDVDTNIDPLTLRKPYVIRASPIIIGYLELNIFLHMMKKLEKAIKCYYFWVKRFEFR
jgi:hypothetical protein